MTTRIPNSSLLKAINLTSHSVNDRPGKLVISGFMVEKFTGGYHS
jgi:hypothetical protein